LSAVAAQTAADAAAVPPRRRRTLSPRLELGLIWLLGVSGSVALIEPSPYEAMFALILPLFLLAGLRLHASGALLLALLAAFNVGGILSLTPHLDRYEAINFIAVSVYLAVTAGFFAMLVQDRAGERLDALKRGLVIAGAIASMAGILGYFNVGGLGAIFTKYDRAAGTFKDPNVLGTFVLLPMVYVAQDILLRRGPFLRNTMLFGLIFFGGVFLSFSRGAWGHAIGSLGLMTALTFLLTANAITRTRIVLLSIAGLVAAGIALAGALSVEEVRTMFEQRASLNQSYDVGETGRFGNQLRSIPDLLERPNGYGPLQFRNYWPEDPHNVYINAFASYGWLGGLSYALLIILTIWVGWRTVAARNATQNHAIAIWSVLFVQIFQGFQIDTDHWRHFYLMLGLIWGLHGLMQRSRTS
jgi:hypothetical protein